MWVLFLIFSTLQSKSYADTYNELADAMLRISLGGICLNIYKMNDLCNSQCVPCCPPGCCFSGCISGPVGPTGATGATGIAETITVRDTTTGEPESDAAVIDATGGPYHVFDFVIPRGATGATGPAGNTGPAGAAATITVGSVITGDPGTKVRITNSGTDENAIFDFVIPSGKPGECIPEVLAMTDDSVQASAAGGALTFHGNPLIFSSAISHSDGDTNITVNQTGIYQVIFQGTVTSDTGTVTPTTFQVSLTQNDIPIPGASARHTFAVPGEENEFSFQIPIRVDTVPSTLSVIPNENGFTFHHLAFTIFRLGSATS